MENNIDGNTVYMYDILTDSWTAKANIPVTSASWIYPVSAVVDNKIIVTGHNAQKIMIYDPKTDRWSERKTNSIIGADQATGTTSGVYAPKRICILGEIYDGSIPAKSKSINQVYDPVKNTWSTAKAMPIMRSGFGVAVVDDVLYVIGGRTNEHGTPRLSLNEQYVPIGYGSISVPSESSKFSLTYFVIVIVTIVVVVVVGGLFFLFLKRGKRLTEGHSLSYLRM
jgi:N-acetylneuraminic acid mutarotase